MIKILLTVIIAITQVYVYFIPQDKVLDRRSKHIKQITKNGWKVITCSVLTITLSIILLIISESESNSFNKKIEQHDSITEINRKNDAEMYIQKLKDNNTETRNALLEYGYEMDSTSMKIQKAIDKAKDTVLKGPNPYLFLKSIKTNSKDNLERKFSFEIFSSDATSYDINITTYMIEQDYSENNRLILRNNSLKNHLVVTKNQGKTLNLTLFNLNPDIEYYYVYLKGTYRKNHNGKNIDIDNVYGYKVKDSTTFEPMISISKNIKSFVMTSIK
ncbi:MULTISPECIES: hypothetical protein [Flavobacterium]|uniref:hypothetical protein n=1 Tax=Flavobacterium TaxID=237 RepID=UPI0011846666|nr:MULTISPECIES: hypothetical protein [Flavobacterium]MCR4033540.1 hypothetical protein [Flavobacterium panacis]